MAGADVPTGIDPTVPPSGTGCAECLAGDGAGWWVHLRRCAQCGHIGCCDTSVSQHATHHARETGHPIMCSFEPREAWFWDYRTEDYLRGPELAPPASRPLNQSVPGPSGKVPANWEELIH